ncbi:MAG: hypothetical protein HWN81_14995 [Candidatus Lokiarchaeota archaeon]|nr:hypothetical protein [Candidatus Lokiarchaeota archaeon]
MQRSVITLILFLLSAQCGFAGNITIGTSLIYTKTNDPSFDYIDETSDIEKPKSLLVGYGTNYKNIYLNVATNRLLSRREKKEVLIGDRVFISKAKLTYDSFQLGYRYNRLIPNIIGINAKLTRAVNGFTKTNYVFLRGVGLNIILTEDIIFNSFYILPNKEIYLEGGAGIGITYNY